MAARFLDFVFSKNKGRWRNGHAVGICALQTKKISQQMTEIKTKSQHKVAGAGVNGAACTQ